MVRVVFSRGQPIISPWNVFMWWLSSLWQSSHLKEGRLDWQGLLGRICGAPSDMMFYEGPRVVGSISVWQRCYVLKYSPGSPLRETNGNLACAQLVPGRPHCQLYWGKHSPDGVSDMPVYCTLWGTPSLFQLLTGVKGPWDRPSSLSLSKPIHEGPTIIEQAADA